MDDIISRDWIRWFLEGYRRLSQMDDINRAWIRWFLEGSRRLSKGMDTVAFAGLSEALANGRYYG